MVESGFETVDDSVVGSGFIIVGDIVVMVGSGFETVDDFVVLV